MALTLRQLISAVALFSGRAGDKKSASMLGFLFSREMQRAALAEPGRAGHRGAKSPAATCEQAALALLSITTGNAPREAVEEAEILYDLPFEGAVRSFTGVQGSCTIPINLHGALDGARFGGLIEALLGSYQLGIGPEAFHADPCTAPFGLRFGHADRGAFGIYERQSLAPNEDGHALLDQLSFARPYALPRRSDAVQRAVFLPIGLIKRIGEALGPMPGISADEVLHLRDEQLAGFGVVRDDFPGATLNFTIGTA